MLRVTRTRGTRRRRLTSAEYRVLSLAKDEAEQSANKLFGQMYLTAVENRLYYKNDYLFQFMKRLVVPPVGIEEFIDSPQFLASTDLVLWPEVRKAVVEINREWWRGDGNGAIFEALLMGSTSSGKSEIAKITTLYHLYLLSCVDVPQALYGLPKTTPIVFAIMAAKPHVTKKVLYMPMRKMVETMPYFQSHMLPDKLVDSEMIFHEKNLRISPGGTDADSILGEAIIGGIIDEVNFMNVVLQSKKAEVSTGRAGVYDQAAAIHSTITRRKKGRFIYRGPQIGVICTSSSTRYKNDFTDKRKAAVLRNNEKNVYVYDKPQFEVWPRERYCGETFRLLVPNDELNVVPRILREDEQVPDNALVFNIPIEYLSDFLQDPLGALRDVCGISSTSINPFIRRRFKIRQAIERGKDQGLESFLVKDNVVLGIDGMPQVKFGHYCQNPSRPRYVHIDLSLNNDACGIAMVRFDGLMDVTRSNGIVEKLPLAAVELACVIKPDADNEIDFGEVRAWVKHLRDVYGYPIKSVTYDGVLSVESIQIWRKQGMKTGHMSVDRTSIPYRLIRDAFYDDRLLMIEQDVVENEFYELEHNEKTDKIDHPVTGTKDGADAVTGAYAGMINRRASWASAATDDEAVARADRVEYEERYGAERVG